MATASGKHGRRDDDLWGRLLEWTSTTLKKYYYADGAVAMLDGATLKYLLADHLGSTAITTTNVRARQTELRYFAYGKTRYTFGAPPTSFKYTGQRQQVNANEMYFYGARWYDGLVGRFLSPDTIVPQPGNPQSLNRYMYVRGNPLKLIDPSGMTECAAGDNACWQAEWEWKNRWYEAHGWFWKNGHWSNRDNARFADEGILRDTMAELGIQFTKLGASWAFSEMSLVAQGVVALANKIGSFAQLSRLLPSATNFMRAHHALFYYADPTRDPPAHTIPGGNFVVFADSLFTQADYFIRGTAVHEVAHLIDYFNPLPNGIYIHQVAPRGTHISDYAVQDNLHLEYWAEMVAVWVYGKSYTDTALGGNSTALTVDQRNWVAHVLSGWGW